MEGRRLRARLVWSAGVALATVAAAAGAHAGFAAGVPVTAATLTAFHPTELPDTCGGTETLTAVADSWIDQAATNATHGADTTLYVAAANGAVRRALVNFSLPTECAVISATLRMYSATAVHGRTIQVYRAGSAWTEAGVTWATRPASSGTAVTAASAAGWMQWDVTAHVTAMSTGGTYGFIIRDMDEGGGTLKQQVFSSREAANAPELVLQW